MKYLVLAICVWFTPIDIAAQSRNKPSKGQVGPPSKTVKGRVVDGNTSQGLEFSTISIFREKDDSLVGGGLSETDGTFSITVEGKEMYAVVEFISYESVRIDSIQGEKANPIINIGDIILSNSSIELEDIEIVGERSQTTFSLDKKVFAVGKDLANTGGTAEDVLDNVPSLDVDIEGEVSLRGSTGVRILIDGKPSSLVGIGNTNGLKNIPANLIEKIEVITNPSARYQAEGMAGIINIVLKKNQGKGFNGSIDVSGGAPTAAGMSANLNYRKGALNWFVNYGLNYDNGPGGGFTIQDQNIINTDTEELSRQVTTLDRNMNRGGRSNSLRFGADYFLSEKEQITGSFFYRNSDDNNDSDLTYQDFTDLSSSFPFEPLWIDTERSDYFDFDTFETMLDDASLVGTTFRTDDEIEDESNLEYSLNYKKEYSSREHALTASIQYRDKGETEKNIFIEDFTSRESEDNFRIDQRGNNDEKEETWELQLDYVHPISKDNKWETGINTSIRNINTEYLVEQLDGTVYAPLPGFDSSFGYTEDIYAAYGLYGNRINDFSYQLGIRGEYATINTILGSDNKNELNKFDVFPTTHLSYHLNDTDALQVSYSRRINRPGFWGLNPFFTFQDRRNFFSGNPLSRPEYTDAYEISQIKYWETVSLTSSIYYRRTAASRQWTLSLDNLTATTLRIPINVGVTEDIGLDLSLSYTGIKWLRINFNTNIFRNKLTLNQDDVLDAVYGYYLNVRGIPDDLSAFESRYSYNLNETNNVSFSSKLSAKFSFWKSNLQIQTRYRGSRETTQGNSQGVGSIDIGWSKDFLSNKNLTITIGVKDLLNSRKRRSLIFLDDYFQQSEFQWRSRSANITASYRINQKKKSYGGKRPS